MQLLCSLPKLGRGTPDFEYGFLHHKFGQEKIDPFESGTCQAKPMTLSFPPGDLHLTKSQSGLFVVRIAGRDILFTKSQRQALARFNAVKVEFEKRSFPAGGNVGEQMTLGQPITQRKGVEKRTRG
jgi:hypothetical protein